MAKIQVDLRRAMLIAASLMLSPAAVAADGKSMAPIPAATLALMKAKDAAPASPDPDPRLQERSGA